MTQLNFCQPLMVTRFTHPVLRVLGDRFDNALRQCQFVHVNRSAATDLQPEYRSSLTCQGILRPDNPRPLSQTPLRPLAMRDRCRAPAGRPVPASLSDWALRNRRRLRRLKCWRGAGSRRGAVKARHVGSGECLGAFEQRPAAFVSSSHLALFLVGHGENAQRQNLIDLGRELNKSPGLFWSNLWVVVENDRGRQKKRLFRLLRPPTPESATSVVALC